jgi:hypothetical protein
MNWLRSKAKKLSLLALFALALQLGLSFGHIHHDVAEPGIAVSASLPLASTPDADHDHQGPHRDLCAICATVAMAHSLIAATPPSLTLPLTLAELHTAYHPEAIASDSRRSAFRSRAPPHS